MAVSIEDIKKLRAMTGAGLADVKKALTEAEGDFDKAKELLRERGLAIAAKRSDREDVYKRQLQTFFQRIRILRIGGSHPCSTDT